MTTWVIWKIEEKMKIGTFEVEYPVGLAPMAGVTDLPYRILCQEKGCDLSYTEMVSAKGMLYKNKNTEELLAKGKEEKNLACQLFGSDPEIMGEIAARLCDRGYQMIDVNMGCPVPKIVGNGEGSALMEKPDLAFAIIQTMVRCASLPITVKIRAGFRNDKKNAPEFAKCLEAAGASGIAVHGRTRDQFYMGEADWDIIRRVKEAVSIPVFGNGDIRCGQDAKRMYEQTGCDGILIGRAARGNPWIFEEVSHYLKTGKTLEKPSGDQVADTILRHAKMIIEFKGEYTGVREMRKHIQWYTTGMKNSSELRRKVNLSESIEDLEEIIKEIRQGR